MTDIDRLKEIVQKLRSETGCPWDRVQTHDSLKAACIEEAAEVINVIKQAFNEHPEIDSSELEVKGAVYNILTGIVEWL